jgi:acetyl esterase/lipase
LVEELLTKLMFMCIGKTFETGKWLIICFVVLSVTACTKNETGNSSTDSNKDTAYFNLPYGASPLQQLDLYLPKGRSLATKLLVLIHGGAWEAGDKSDFNSHI